MKNHVIALSLWLVCGLAQAAGPLIGLEYESERDNNSGITNQSVDVVPGWEFDEHSIISRIELLIDRNRDSRAGADGVLAKGNKLFLRLRHDGEITEKLDYYIRGGVGRSFNNQGSFNYAYVEPGIEYELAERLEWILAIRETHSIDGTAGQHVTQIRTGASFNFDKKNELEVLYTKGNGDENTRSWVLEYVHRF